MFSDSRFTNAPTSERYGFGCPMTPTSLNPSGKVPGKLCCLISALCVFPFLTHPTADESPAKAARSAKSAPRSGGRATAREMASAASSRWWMSCGSRQKVAGSNPLGDEWETEDFGSAFSKYLNTYRVCTSCKVVTVREREPRSVPESGDLPIIYPYAFLCK